MGVRYTIIVAVLLGFAAPQAGAATISVDSLRDDDAGCTLRNAVLSANADAAVGDCAAGSGADTITFAADGTAELVKRGRDEDNGLTGDLDITSSVTIQGNGADATIIDANAQDGVIDTFGAPNGTDITIRDVTITGGDVASSLSTAGGGIYAESTVTMTVEDAKILENRARSYGAGIYAKGTLIVRRSMIAANYGAVSGGGIQVSNGVARLTMSDTTVTGNQAGRGGGLLLQSYSGAASSIAGSTISANSATASTDGTGGGVFLDTDGEFTVSASTVSDNSARVGGGGISYRNAQTPPGGSLAVVDTTVAANRADSDGDGTGDGGGVLVNSGAVRLTRTVVATNLDGGIADRPDVAGTFTAPAHVLIGSADGATGFTPGPLVGANGTRVDPQLGPLVANGGSTFTRLPLAGSPAIDAGGTGCSGNDQRGMARPFGAACDIGAVETGPDETAPETAIASGPDDPTTSTTASFTFASTDDGGSGIAGHRCRLDSDGPFTECPSPATYSVGEGTHVFEAIAVDEAGNEDATPAAYTWTVEAEPTPSPSPSPSPSPTASPSPSPTASPSPSPSPEPTATPSPSPSPTASPSPSPGPTATPSPSPSPGPTTTPSPSPSPSPTATPSPSPSPSPTATPSPSPSPSPTATPSPSPSPSPGPTVTPSPSPSPGPTATPSPSPSPGPTATPSPSPSPGPTATPSPSPSPSPTASPSPSPSPSPTATPSPEPSVTPSPSPSPSPTATPRPSPSPGPSPPPSPEPTSAPSASPSPAETPSPSPEPPVGPVGIKDLRTGDGKVTFTANAAGRVTIRIGRLVAGRRKGKSCVAARKAKPRAKRCTRRVIVRTLRRPIEPGFNSIRIGKLSRGRYLIDVVASSGGSRAVEAGLTIRR